MPRDRDHLRRHVLTGLPDVVKRVELMRSGKGPQSATECSEARALQARNDAQYRKGVSSWNFDVEALKKQARAPRLV